MSLSVPEVAATREAIERAQQRQPDLWEAVKGQQSWEIYTDGSAPIKNPGGAIGFSSVFLVGDAAWEVYGGTPGRSEEPATSNNRAEIAGVLTILEVYYLLSTEGDNLPSRLDIVCDSQYVVNCAQGKWKKHKNKDLWRRFDQLMCTARRLKTSINFRWTRAHVGTHWNERADVLAKDGAYLAIGREVPQESDLQTPPSSQSTASSHPVAGGAQYTLSLFSKMDGTSAATGVYRLATPSKERVQSLDLGSVKTLDEAEYQALIHGLRDLVQTLEAAQRNPEEFSIAVESCRDLMLKQIQGKYGVKSERLQPLHQQATSLARRFSQVHWNQTDKGEAKRLETALSSS